jgi:hypothetical protein
MVQLAQLVVNVFFAVLIHPNPYFLASGFVVSMCFLGFLV